MKVYRILQSVRIINVTFSVVVWSLLCARIIYLFIYGGGQSRVSCDDKFSKYSISSTVYILYTAINTNFLKDI